MPQTRNMPLSFFKVKSQVRKAFDEQKERLLGESMAKRQLQPVLAQPDGTIIAGERRYRAAKLVGLQTLEVKIADEPLSDSEAKEWQLAENMLREDLTGYEQWLGCTDLMSMHVDWQSKDLADYLKLDPSMVTRLLSPSKCVREVQDALKEGKLGISHCYALSRLPPEKQRSLLALKLSGATRDDLEKAGRAVRNGTKQQSAVKVSRVRCVLPSGINIVVAGKRVTIDDVIESLAEAGKEARKARDQGQDAKTFEAIMKNKAKTTAA